MSNINRLFNSELNPINIGLETFYDTFNNQKVNAIHLEWKPPAQGDTKLGEILSKLNLEKINAANKKAFMLHLPYKTYVLACCMSCLL